MCHGARVVGTVRLEGITLSYTSSRNIDSETRSSSVSTSRHSVDTDYLEVSHDAKSG